MGVGAGAAPRRALVAGATGLVGQALVSMLAADPRWSEVHLLVRRAPQPHELPADPLGTLRPRVIDFDHLGWLEPFPAVDDVFLCLGTTMKAAGSREAFRRIDFDLVVGVARFARRHGAHTLAAVSAIGADPASRHFYNRVKGEAERALAALGYASCTLVRPSILDGPRRESRPLERSALLAMKALGRLLPARWRPVAAHDVAVALREAALRGLPGLRIVESDRIRALGAG